jgi:hypothetical protein
MVLGMLFRKKTSFFLRNAKSCLTRKSEATLFFKGDERENPEYSGMNETRPETLVV